MKAPALTPYKEFLGISDSIKGPLGGVELTGCDGGAQLPLR